LVSGTTCVRRTLMLIVGSIPMDTPTEVESPREESALSMRSSATNVADDQVTAESADTDTADGEDGAQTAWTPPTWDQVVREHADRVYRLAYRLSGNAHDAEDLTQDTFIRVFRSLASFRPGTFEGWLHRITTNLFLDMA